MREDGTVYLNSEKSANTHWAVEDVDDRIQLMNVITTRFLFRNDKSIGTAKMKHKNSNGTFWTLHEISQSNQISLKSYKNDYLNSETDK